MKKQTKKSFFQKVKANNECLEFTGCISKYGYGVVGYLGKVYQAHRLSYKLTKGEIPASNMVCHSCDNRKCINPAHLFLGTAKDNTSDMFKKGRNRKRGKAIK